MLFRHHDSQAILRRLALGLTSAALFAAPPAFAEIDEIVVTATGRESSSQSIPISVTALGATDVPEDRDR